MRLVGLHRCLDCGGVSRICYRTDTPGLGECLDCGAMATVPEGLQLPATYASSAAVPRTREMLAHALIGDALEDRDHRLAARGRES